MRPQFIIASADVEKLKQKARRLKKENGVPHHEALDQVAKAAGFDHWHHVSESAKAFAPTEQAYYFGVIIAMDIKDGMDFRDPSGNFVEDDVAFALCAEDIYAYVREADEEHDVDTDDQVYSEDLDEWKSDMIMNYMFFRFTGTEIPASVKDVVSRASSCCFWLPEFIWHKGTFQECPTNVVLDDGRHIVGL